MKRKVFVMAAIMSLGLLYMNQNVEAKGFEALDINEVVILKPLQNLLPDMGGFSEFLWWPPQEPTTPPPRRRRGGDGGRHGGGVGAPLDGGLLALLAGAGIFYFGARITGARKNSLHSFCFITILFQEIVAGSAPCCRSGFSLKNMTFIRLKTCSLSYVSGLEYLSGKGNFA